MADTTPIHKRPTAELPALDLVLYRLKQVERLAERGEEQNQEILRSIISMHAKFDNGERRMNEIDKHLEATDGRVESLAGDKRGVAGIIAGIAAGLAALGSYFK